MTALKALHYINRYIEPLAYEYNCRRGTCGCCAMMINDLPHLACYFRLSQEQIIKPLLGCMVIRDLVVDKRQLKRKFIESANYQYPVGQKGIMKPISGEFWRDTIAPINSCRKCLCCYAACSTIQSYGRIESFLGPGAFQQLYLQSLEDIQGQERVAEAVKGGLFECTHCGMCTLVCPARIDCADHIRIMAEKAEVLGIEH